MLNPYPVHRDAQQDRMDQHNADMLNKSNHKMEQNRLTIILSTILIVLCIIIFNQITK